MDKVLHPFLIEQHGQGMALAAQSDLLTLLALDTPPQHYIATFRCKGLVQEPSGVIAEAEEFHVGIWLPDDYLRRIEPFQVVTWLAPPHVFHPQIRPPFICLGHLVVGTPLVDILFQIWEEITYRKLTMREDDALNPTACAWARHHMHRFPIDPRPLKRRPVEFTVTPLEGAR
jgi:hypothetical protein